MWMFPTPSAVVRLNTVADLRSCLGGCTTGMTVNVHDHLRRRAYDSRLRPSLIEMLALQSSRPLNSIEVLTMRLVALGRCAPCPRCTKRLDRTTRKKPVIPGESWAVHDSGAQCTVVGNDTDVLCFAYRGAERDIPRPCVCVALFSVL